jgi:hypothetical protein
LRSGKRMSARSISPSVKIDHRPPRDNMENSWQTYINICLFHGKASSCAQHKIE